MMLSLRSINLAELLLSRLLFSDETGLTTSTIKGSIAAIAACELSNSAFTEQVNMALTGLVQQHFVQSVSRSRYSITSMGRQHILKALNIKPLPPKLQWNTFKNTDLMAYVLNLPQLSTETRKRLGNADGLRAAILKKGFNLPINDFVTLTQARNALLWQQLCDPTAAQELQKRLPKLRQQAFNQGTVMGALLNGLLQASKPLPWKKALPQLVAKIAKARRTAPDELRVAILRQAFKPDSDNSRVIDRGLEPAKPDESARSTNGQGSKTVPIRQFAEMALKAARATTSGRLGDDKVFISRVWDTFSKQHPNMAQSCDQFKQLLISANQQQQLKLSRADLAYALDANDVSASEISHLNSTFHFIYID